MVSADEPEMMTSFIPFYFAFDYQRNMKKVNPALEMA